MPSGRPPNLARRQMVLDLRAQGLTLTQIGRRLGITRQAAHSSLRKAAAPLRRAACSECGEAIDPRVVLPREVKKALCLICAARREGEEFGITLRAVRLAVSLTRTELSRLVGLGSANAIKQYEVGEVRPTRERLEQLATALGVPSEALGSSDSITTRRGRPPKKRTP